ncbi:uncharacterized protein E0L32_011476 [Thyridium curvatum]|uniref:Uncharacterized protein n=1 Tax=Thyridium curvatum TaxID=1093900 RepID=A0A507BNL7_9PEZI|nr:uncharacterized protein E0L32_011476 [Thyridium curvatum]TPX18861.1 hypothetical protein E0L32_011476 [Thyridium curvatum]
MASNDSNNDPYNTGPIPSTHTREWLLQNSTKLTIPWEALPQLPFWGPLGGFTQPWFRANIAARVIAGAHLMKRELEQPEIDALSYHMAKALRTRSMEVPILLGAVFVLERRGRSTFKFPFYQPKPGFEPLVFPSKMSPLLTGTTARAAWHACRASAYAVVTHFFVSLFLQSYSNMTWIAHMQRDERLNEFNKVARSEIEHELKRRAASGDVRPLPGRSPIPAEGSGDYQPASSENQDSYAEASRSQPAPQRSWARDSYQGPAPPAAQESQPSQLFEDDAYVFDDASPVAPSQRQKPQTSSSPYFAGTAWDRVRQQSGAPRPEPAERGSRDSQTRSWGDRQQVQRQSSRTGQSGTEYTFSQAEEDRSLPKEQAQKDFDAMLERERAGESDDRRRRCGKHRDITNLELGALPASCSGVGSLDLGNRVGKGPSHGDIEQQEPGHPGQARPRRQVPDHGARHAARRPPVDEPGDGLAAPVAAGVGAVHVDGHRVPVAAAHGRRGADAVRLPAGPAGRHAAVHRLPGRRGAVERLEHVDLADARPAAVVAAEGGPERPEGGPDALLRGRGRGARAQPRLHAEAAARRAGEVVGGRGLDAGRGPAPAAAAAEREGRDLEGARGRGGDVVPRRGVGLDLVCAPARRPAGVARADVDGPLRGVRERARAQGGEVVLEEDLDEAVRYLDVPRAVADWVCRHCRGGEQKGEDGEE